MAHRAANIPQPSPNVNQIPYPRPPCPLEGFPSSKGKQPALTLPCLRAKMTLPKGAGRPRAAQAPREESPSSTERGAG